MWTKWAAAALVLVGLTVESHAADRSSSVVAKPVVWRNGLRFRSYSNRSTGNYAASRGVSNYGYRGSSGRTSALDYPSWTQPYISRTNPWNKYPNQPYYLRGERKSLLILP